MYRDMHIISSCPDTTTATISKRCRPGSGTGRANTASSSTRASCDDVISSRTSARSSAAEPMPVRPLALATDSRSRNWRTSPPTSARCPTTSPTSNRRTCGQISGNSYSANVRNIRGYPATYRHHFHGDAITPSDNCPIAKISALYRGCGFDFCKLDSAQTVVVGR